MIRTVPTPLEINYTICLPKSCFALSFDLINESKWVAALCIQHSVIGKRQNKTFDSNLHMTNICTGYFEYSSFICIDHNRSIASVGLLKANALY